MIWRARTLFLRAGAVLLALAATLACASPAGAQATRTWVSGVGDDVNPCSRTAPCKTFAGSISKTAAGGEINALDSAGFGSVNITKSMTIDGTGAHASILSSGTTGVVINAGVNDRIVLRNLSINGASTVDCGAPATAGIRVLRAGSVVLDNVTVLRQATGIAVLPIEGAPQVSVLGGELLNGCPGGVGVNVAPAAGATASVVIDGARLVGNDTAVRVADGGSALVANSTLAHNALGFLPVGAGTIAAQEGNLLFANAADGSPTTRTGVIVAPEGPAGVAGPQGPAGPPGPTALVAPPAAATCKVPKLTGLKLASAKTAIKAAGCKVGAVKRAKTTNAKRVGKVTKQTVKAGTSVPAGTKVGITLGRR